MKLTRHFGASLQMFLNGKSEAHKQRGQGKVDIDLQTLLQNDIRELGNCF